MSTCPPRWIKRFCFCFLLLFLNIQLQNIFMYLQVYSICFQFLSFSSYKPMTNAISTNFPWALFDLDVLAVFSFKKELLCSHTTQCNFTVQWLSIDNRKLHIRHEFILIYFFIICQYLLILFSFCQYPVHLFFNYSSSSVGAVITSNFSQWVIPKISHLILIVKLVVFLVLNTFVFHHYLPTFSLSRCKQIQFPQELKS